MARDIHQTFRALQDDAEPLEGVPLRDLSNLTREEQSVLEEAWPRIPLDKRRRLVVFLSEAADEDVQLDYSAIFRHGLRDADAEVRRLSVEGLWEDERVTLIRPLLTLLRQDESVVVRASAATALGRFVLQGELEQLPAERLAEIVAELVQIASNEAIPLQVRRRVVESLGYSSDERVPEFIQRAYHDGSEELRASALFAMGRSADDGRWASIVHRELSNENPAIRFEAARAAGELGDRKAVGELVALLADSDKEIRTVAVWALGEIGGSAAKSALRQVAAGEDRELRRIARDSLAQLALLDDQHIAPELPALPESEEGEEEAWAWDEDEEIWDEDDEDDEDDRDWDNEDDEDDGDDEDEE